MNIVVTNGTQKVPLLSRISPESVFLTPLVWYEYGHAAVIYESFKMASYSTIENDTVCDFVQMNAFGDIIANYTAPVSGIVNSVATDRMSHLIVLLVGLVS